ncbi:UNVERIFIED_CONTAM: hypothetical protein FKN15_028197 [Acipenser sinensis]
MSGERNRRSLVFRGGGLAAAGCSASGISSSNSGEAQVWQERNLNGNRPEQDEEVDQEEKISALEGVEDGVSMSDSTGPEAEEDDAEGGNWEAGNGVDEGVGIISGDGRLSLEGGDDGQGEGGSWGAGNGLDDVDGVGLGSGNTVLGEDDREGSSRVDGEETVGRKSGLEMRPQTLLQKHCLFQGSWLQEFPWLHFCQETGLMACSWCHNTGSSCNDELAKGSRNYKRALLLRHHLSADHRKNDPSKKAKAHMSEALSSKLLRLVEDNLKNDGNHACTSECSTENLPVKKKTKTEQQWNCYFVDSNKHTTSKETLIQREMMIYASETPLNISEDPLIWWKNNQTRFPSLAALAKSMLSIPATSVLSERVFSKAGMLVNKLRSSLKPENVDAIIFLNKNRK